MTKRSVATIAAVALVAGLLTVAPADAAKKCRKKKSCKPAPAPCSFYAPGEEGQGAETMVLTDANSEAAALETTVTTEPAFASPLWPPDPVPDPPETRSRAYLNVQVDPAAPQTGLYVRLEFDEGQDYDLYLLDAEGNTVASAAGWNQMMLIPDDPIGGNDTDSGGYSETGAEVLDGITSLDCQGYTLSVVTFEGTGGDLPLKLWLGEAKYVPPPPDAS